MKKYQRKIEVIVAVDSQVVEAVPEEVPVAEAVEAGRDVVFWCI